jgi:hypothetical protein
MSINFIVNDPAVSAAAAKVITPSPDRPASQATFAVDQLPAEQVYPVNTTNFVAWQAREAALRALAAFEAIAGPLPGWTGDPAVKQLDLLPNAGQDLNAYYDRASISFYELQGSRQIFSGASTDVVAHEAGHAILDALRPDLWNVNMTEVQAFHEGFGDCIAVMTALSDRDTRLAILQNDPTLSNGNFVEALAEDLSAAIGTEISPNHNAAQPRHALNAYQWAFPQSLPDNGGPGVLIDEIHSFGQLTGGCYYDLIREIFQAGPSGEANLWQACQIATRLLALAVKAAQIRPRFLETVGRTMILADRQQQTNADGTGPNEAHIKAAFGRHGISLSVTNFFAPRNALSAAPKAAAAAVMTPKARQQLRSILEIDTRAKLESRSFALGDTASEEVSTLRPVDLTGLSERLTNVKAYTPQVALVGQAGGATAVLGLVDPAMTISSEVREYVRTLVKRKLIDFDGGSAGRSKAKSARSGGVVPSQYPTYGLKRRGKEVVLERLHFACACRRSSFRCADV